MGKKPIDDGDQQTLRVLKMQEAQLDRLTQQTSSQQQSLAQLDQRLADLRRRTLQLAEAEHAGLPAERHLPIAESSATEKMNHSQIPSWDALAQRAQQAFGGTIGVEDLLSADEIRMAEAEVKRINDAFSSRTGLTSGDMAFLTLATSIQMTRWMMMPRLVSAIGTAARLLGVLSPSVMARLEHHSASDGDRALIDQLNQEFASEAGTATATAAEGHKSWEQILEDGATATDGSTVFGNRAMDWLFGVLNNITGTKTDASFSTVDAATGEVVGTASMLADALRSIKEDWLRLPAAVYAQYARDRVASGHSADLLEPLATSFSPEMLSDLYTSQFLQFTAIEELTLVGRQAAVPLVINMVVGLLHGFMYNPATDGPRPFYDARTRKILVYSNAMATAANLSVAAASENWASLDVGGLMVAGIRLVQDAAYMALLKDQFLKQELDKKLEMELQDIDSHFQNFPATL